MRKEGIKLNLLRNRIARRVSAVGVGVGLLVLGLEAPAFAAAPVVSSFSPASGPAAGGCVVVITGTGLDDFPDAVVTFDAVGTAAIPTADATGVLLIDDATLYAASPALSPGVDYTITVTNSGGTSTSTGTFLATSGAGACAPTVDSFVPTCGSAGDTVVITGTNLLNADFSGGEVRFNPYTATEVADFTVPDASDVTTLSVVVPDTAADGPIEVTTDVDSAFSEASFLVPPPDCTAAEPLAHARAITLSLKKHLVAKGMVSLTDADDTLTACIAGVPVKIQRRKGGHWKTVGKATTKDSGAYKTKIKDKPGKYRAKAPKVSPTTTDVCSPATSRTVKHK
jgi:hypothetical protein